MNLDLKKSTATWRRWVTPNNLALYVFAIIAFSLSWSTAKVIQKNYSIQKDITALQQENEVRELENKKLKYQITYYKTNAYVELEARRKFNKSAPGEKVIVFPRPTTAEPSDDTIDPSELTATSQLKDAHKKTTWGDNLRAWKDFLLFNSHN